MPISALRVALDHVLARHRQPSVRFYTSSAVLANRQT